MTKDNTFAKLAEQALRFAELCNDMSKHDWDKSADDNAWREDYRKKQAAGVKFEFQWSDGVWLTGKLSEGLSFSGNKEDYREVEEAPKPTIPHLAERKLWLAQREAGTNEVWQWENMHGIWMNIYDGQEPKWLPGHKYRVKPKTIKHYITILKNSQPHVYAFTAGSHEEIIEHAKHWNITIIGNIVEMEVEL